MENTLDHELRTLYRIPPGEDLIPTLHAKFRANHFGFYNPVLPGVLDRVVEECLASTDPLLAFTAYYTTFIQGAYPFTLHWGVLEFDGGMSNILFRLGPFQVQQYLFRPGFKIKTHSHPNVDTFELYICGVMDLLLDHGDGCMVNHINHDFTGPTHGGTSGSQGALLRIRPGQRHGGYVYPTCSEEGGTTAGASFISIQHWLNSKPTSVHLDWIGDDGSHNG
jgi:hypothetical protein